jgi:rhodanese-related sulfurtransferase
MAKFNLVCFLLIATLISCSSKGQKTNVPVDEFEKAIKTQKVQLLDVRTAEEYEAGHLQQSLQANWNNKEEFIKRVSSLDKNIPVYTYCLSGARSAAATDWLNANGYTAFNMQGGINKWKAGGKEVEQNTVVKQLSMEEYMQQIPADKTVLVDFGAAWCPPCKRMDIALKELQEKYGSKFTLVKIDGGIHTDLLKSLQIEELPTFIIYKNGQQTWTKNGVLTVEEINQQL